MKDRIPPSRIPPSAPLRPLGGASVRLLNIPEAMSEAGRAYGRCDWSAAEQICRSILKVQSEHFDALSLLGIIAAQTRRVEESARLLGRAAAQTQNPDAHNNYGNVLRELKRFDDAIDSYERALRISPDHAEAWNNRGVALQEQSRVDEALESYDRALSIKPSLADALNHRGVALQALGRYGEALASYGRALSARPDYAEAYNNRGNALRKLGRFDEALEDFRCALQIAPQYAEAYNNRGAVLQSLKRPDEALESYARALELNPHYAEVFVNRGFALQELGRHAEALQSYAGALEINPDSAEAFNNRGTLLQELKRYDEALADFERALEIKPNLPWLRGSWLAVKIQINDWIDLAARIPAVLQDLSESKRILPPFWALAITDSPALQHKAAAIWVEEKCPTYLSLPPIPKREHGKRIRIGVFSPDLCNHAVSILTVELFEIHDRERFELVAFSLGRDTQDALRLRMQRAFDRFIDVQGCSDRQIAKLSRELRIDIALDLAGFTAGGRPGVFALRAAPLQVSYLGYLGTIAAGFMDYLIADTTIIPQTHRKHYSEKIIYLPSYQANDSRRAIAPRVFSREELGLPAQGFVYCCFNGNYKITPDTFAGWMRILSVVEGSVLLLYRGSAAAERNLKTQASKAGIDADRLIFGGPLPHPEYLARYRAADLFLDTLPYNAGTTASDALWAGLPVLTRLGEAFAGRVAGSLLMAVGLPQLITHSQVEYEERALQLAKEPERLAQIRRQLAENRLRAPLFDTPRFARRLESAYTRIYERYQADLPPEHVFIEAQGI